MVMTLCPSLDSSMGSPDTTSPNPPVLLQGVTSAETNTKFNPAVVVNTARLNDAATVRMVTGVDRRGVALGKRRAD